MSTFNVTFSDPNAVGTVTAYGIKFLDANGAAFITQSMVAPVNPANQNRSFSYPGTIPAALPVSVQITAVNNGIASDPAVYVSSLTKPNPVVISGLTIS